MLAGQRTGTRSCAMYSKREGSSGIRGQLYETKLISLLYLRAFRDDAIEEFHLASNIADIGALDDICFKAKVKGHDKPVAVFIQAKHKEKMNDELKIDLTTYFDSYLKIRDAFDTSKNNLFFKGAYAETDCKFVIYTNAEVKLDDDSVESKFSSHLYDLIGTGDDTVKPKQVNDVSSLQEAVVNHRVTLLAIRMAEFICKGLCKGTNDLQNIMSDKLVKEYHVLLAQKVFHVSEIQPLRIVTQLCNGKEIKKNCQAHRIATFRHDFISTNDKHLTLFKDKLFEQILRKRKIKPADGETFLSEFLAEPTDATRLSKLIGTVVTYNKDRLEYLQNKKKNTSTNDSRPRLGQLSVSRSTVAKAVELAAREMFLTQKFKVLTAFGNKDLVINGDDAKETRKIEQIASKMDNLIKNSGSKKITIDDAIANGFNELKGGLAGAVGNLFVLDGNLMKINTDSIGKAKILYEKLKAAIPDLLEYKFCFAVSNVPKLTFDSEIDEHETNLAKDFLDKLLIYSKQGNEESIEEISKREIKRNANQCDRQQYFQAKTDAIFVKYHDDIQKWWKQPEKAPYLTQESDLIQNAKNNIIKDPLTSSVNIIYMSKIKNNYVFSDDAVMSLNIQDQHSSTVILAEHSVLTVVKVIQYLKNKNKEYVVLDLEYIVNLPSEDQNPLRTEIAEADKDKYLIFVYDKIQRSNENKILDSIAADIQGKKNIFITNSIETLKMLRDFFSVNEESLNDKKNSLINMSEGSQKSILENVTAMFQGIEVNLDLIVDDKSKSYVTGDVLNKIFSEEIIVIGNPIIDRHYDKIKHLYADRRLNKIVDSNPNPTKKLKPEDWFKGINVIEYSVELNPPSGELGEEMKADPTSSVAETSYKTQEVLDDVVLVTAESGMGKSTLLTDLSLETKKLEPAVRIERINKVEYTIEIDPPSGLFEEEMQADPTSSVAETSYKIQEVLDDVVLVTAESGMGKSTLLTHLSLETKKLEPEVWIVRINLLEYSGEFNKWKEEQTDIDSLETLKFMCQVILREKLGKNNIEIVLEEENDVVNLKCCTADQWTEFELKLFLHFFCERQVLILIDGFDEICPFYKDLVYICLKNISNYPRKHRMWITSRPYNEMITILKEELGSPYEIRPFSHEEMEGYLKKIWASSLSIKKLNSKQLENVKKFLDSVSAMNNELREPLYDIIKMAAYHFCSEITAHTSSWPYKEDYSTKIKNDWLFKDVNLLYVNLAAGDIEYNIKKYNNTFENFYINCDTYTVYERFLKSKIEKEFQKEERDIYSSAARIALEKEFADSVLKHKKLAAYAIFNRHSQRLFSVTDLENIKKMITGIGKGAEKMNLIDKEANEVPIFIHMSFTEYFALEYVCDCLKNESINKTEFILDLMFSDFGYESIRKIFNHKIKIDETLMRILKNNNEVIFRFLNKKEDFFDSSLEALAMTVHEHLNNIISLFAQIINDNVNTSNLNDFPEIVKLFKLFEALKHYTIHKEYIVLLLDMANTHFDESCITCTLRDYFDAIPMISGYTEKTSEEIIKLMMEDLLPAPDITRLFGFLLSLLLFLLRHLDHHTSLPVILCNVHTFIHARREYVGEFVPTLFELDYLVT